MATGRVNVGGSGAGLNIFTQLSEPATKEGIWIQTSHKYKKVISPESFINGVSWAELNDYPSFPYSLFAHSISEKDGLVYIIGGDNTNITRKMFVYDTNTNLFTEKAALRDDTRYHSSVILGNYLYVFGGSGGASRLTRRYDIANDTWEPNVATMPMDSNLYQTAVVVGTKIYVIGTNTSYKMVQIFDTTNNTWTSNQNAPYAYKYAKAVEYNGNIYVFGGTVGSTPFSDIYKLDLDTNLWSKVGDMPVSLMNHEIVLYQNKAYIFGGLSTSTTVNTKVYEFDFDNFTFSELPSMPAPASGARGAFVNNKIYAFGGSSTNGSSTATNSTQVLRLEPTVFPENTFILFRMNENKDKYLIELVTPNQKIDGVKTRMLTGFNNAWIYVEGSLQEYPTYIGDGEQWVKIKN